MRKMKNLMLLVICLLGAFVFVACSADDVKDSVNLEGYRNQ